MGFLFVNWLAAQHAARWKINKKISAEIAPVSLSTVNGQSFDAAQDGQSTFFLCKPIGYMNESGIAVKRLLSKYRNIEISKYLVVAHDDSDIPLGSFKISSNKGSAGHKGVASCIASLGTNNFLRIRIGVRPQQETRRAKAELFVLKKVTSAHKKILEGVFLRIEKALMEYAAGKVKPRT